MNIYSETDYRKILQTVVDERKSLGIPVTYSAMAEASRVQKPYVSKVLSGFADFNSDQLYMALKYLDFSSEDIDYMQKLLDLEKCSYPERKKLLENEIKSIQKEKRDTGKVLEKSVDQMEALEFDRSKFVEYYLDPDLQIIHVHLCMKKYRDNPEIIKGTLEISDSKFENAIISLEKMKLIEMKEGKVKVLKRSLHLPKDSKLVLPHQILMKQKSIYHLGTLQNDNRKNFAVTFASNEKAKVKIEEAFNEFIARVRALSGEGRPDTCYQLNFDLFPWSKKN